MVVGLHLMTMQGVVLGSGVESTAVLSDFSQASLLKGENENSVDLLTLTSFILSQIYVADTAAVFPTLPFLRLSPSLRFTKLEVFDKKDVGTHMYYGTFFDSCRTQGRDAKG
jgi:hypothetical protein